MAGRGCRYRIGYALSPKKVETFIQPSLLNLAQERGIELVPVQLDTPLLDQGPFNCLIHKLSHPDWIHQLQQFLSQNPDVVVIDPPDAVHCLHNRITMLQVINQLQISQLGVPNQVSVEDDSHCLLASSKGVEFPVIAKPLVANGSAGSHQMSLVFNEEGLRGLGLNPPFILQEFVNHGGVIFKVYVAGRHVQCVKRKSLPDIGGTSDDDVLTFSQISNLSGQVMEAVELPPADFVNQVAAHLRQALKLNLFNFDMIRDSRIHGKYLVIDINYFPGYAKLPNYETILTDFFLDVVEKDFEPV